MSRDEQIDEMAKDLCHTETCEINKIGIPCNHRCKAHIYATRAIDKGYRKLVDVALAVTDDFQRRIRHIFLNMCNYNDYNTLNLLAIDGAIEALYDTFVAELKKKYTETTEGE